MAVEKLRDANDSMSTKDEELASFDEAISNDLNTAQALTIVEAWLKADWVLASKRLTAIGQADEVLGLRLLSLKRDELRVRPATATFTKADVESLLAERREARAAKDFARSDAIRDELTTAGVEVMDGDPLGWDWRPTL